MCTRGGLRNGPYTTTLSSGSSSSSSSSRMAKGKPQTHSAKEMAEKAKLALQNAGGGKAGKEDRLGGKAGHAKYVCYICKVQCPDMKTMGTHFEAKHPKETMDESKFVDTHAIYGATTQGIAVHGTLKNAKKKNDEKGAPSS